MYIPNTDTVLVGVQDGRIFRTTWNGAAWTALAALTTPRASAVVSDLLVHPANANRMWAVYSSRPPGGRVFRSDNAGSTWTDVSAGLPAIPGNAIETDPSNANRVWVAMDLGVYQSLNAGANWADFSASLPNAITGDLVFHPHARVLRAGTRNRGRVGNPGGRLVGEPDLRRAVQRHAERNETKRWFTFNWPATWHMVWTVMPTTVKNGAPEITWSVQVERADAEHLTYWITVAESGERSGGVRRALLHFEPLLTGDQDNDNRSAIHWNAGTERHAEVVHVQLEPRAAHHLDRRADDGQERRAGDSMVRRCRTGDPDNLHLLDHGDQSDQCQHYF